MVVNFSYFKYKTVGIGVTGLVASYPYSVNTGKIMLAFLCIGVYSANLGPNGCGWIYIGESGSLRLRAKTATVGTLGNGIVGVVYNVAIPYMLTENRLGVGGSAI
jgi:Sugar (and other) transporter